MRAQAKALLLSDEARVIINNGCDALLKVGGEIPFIAPVSQQSSAEILQKYHFSHLFFRSIQVFKVLSDVKAIVDLSSDQDEECKRLSDWCGLTLGIVVSLAHDHKEKNSSIHDDVQAIMLEAKKALLDILKLVKKWKGTKGIFGGFKKLATVKNFKEQSEKAQKTLRDLLQALQLGVSKEISKKVCRCCCICCFHFSVF